MTICSPNYLHVPHMKFSLRNGIDVICEKPLSMSNKELDELHLYEKEYEARVNSILQLRLHPAIIDLKNKIDKADSQKYMILT